MEEKERAVVRVDLRDGRQLEGVLMDWRPREGWFDLGGEDAQRVHLENVSSGTIDDGLLQDLLERARNDGWED